MHNAPVWEDSKISPGVGLTGMKPISCAGPGSLSLSLLNYLLHYFLFLVKGSVAWTTEPSSVVRAPYYLKSGCTNPYWPLLMLAVHRCDVFLYMEDPVYQIINLLSSCSISSSSATCYLHISNFHLHQITTRECLQILKNCFL